MHATIVPAVTMSHASTHLATFAVQAVFPRHTAPRHALPLQPALRVPRDDLWRFDSLIDPSIDRSMNRSIFVECVFFPFPTSEQGPHFLR